MGEYGMVTNNYHTEAIACSRLVLTYREVTVGVNATNFFASTFLGGN